jgi:hypothetical protein
MNPVFRFLIGLPIALPLLAYATWLDFMLAPVSDKIEGDPPQDIAQVAWRILGVQ